MISFAALFFGFTVWIGTTAWLFWVTFPFLIRHEAHPPPSCRNHTDHREEASPLCAMTSHGDAIEKMSAFASRADSFVNAALDQLDDAVEQAFVGETSDDVDAVQRASLTPQQQSLLRAAAAFWSDLALDAKREDWRDAATRVAGARAGAEASKRALAERVKAARSEPSEETRDALTLALTKELAAATRRAEFAETAFMSMLNDVDEAPDPAAPLALAQDAAAVVSAAARARQELEALRAARGVAAAAADELEALRGSLEARVEEAASARAREAEGRAAAAEVRADAAMRAREAAEADLAKASRARDDAESRAFELESSRDSAAALVDLETADAETGEVRAMEEIRRLRRELNACVRARGSSGKLGASDGDAPSLESGERDAAAPFDADAEGRWAAATASLRDRLAVRERVAEQLKLALEEAEAAREAEREAAAAQLEAAAEAHADAMESARREAEEKAGAETAREKARAAALEARVATLRALVDAEDAETAETAAARTEGTNAGEGDGDAYGETVRAEARDAPLAAARARNKRLAGEAASARRAAAEATARAEDAERRAEAAASAAESRAVAVAELERHLVATTGEQTPKTRTSSAERTDDASASDVDAAASASLLPMVAAQRDRHKRRASELEIRVAELEASLATATEERERSRADAAALYDKVRHVQDYYREKTSLETGAETRALDLERGPLAALAARRAARYGCFFPRGTSNPSSSSAPPVPLDQLPGGDPGGVLARFALMKNASHAPSAGAGSGPFPYAGFGLGGKTRAAKLTRLFFVAYLAVMHVFLFRAAIGGTVPTAGAENVAERSPSKVV